MKPITWSSMPLVWLRTRLSATTWGNHFACRAQQIAAFVLMLTLCASGADKNRSVIFKSKIAGKSFPAQRLVATATETEEELSTEGFVPIGELSVYWPLSSKEVTETDAEGNAKAAPATEAEAQRAMGMRAAQEGGQLVMFRRPLLLSTQKFKKGHCNRTELQTWDEWVYDRTGTPTGLRQRSRDRCVSWDEIPTGFDHSLEMHGTVWRYEPDLARSSSLPSTSPMPDSKMFAALRDGDMSALRRVIAERAAVVNEPISYMSSSRNPLHWAVYFGRTEAIPLLIANGADLYAKDSVGWGVMGRAIRSNHPDAVRALVAGGYKLNDPNQNLLRNILYNAHRAAELGLPPNRANYLSGAKLLLELGADPNTTYQGNPVLFECSTDAELLTALLASGARPNFGVKAGLDGVRAGTTPLMRAVEAGCTECVEVLMKSGANPNLRDSSGASAADIAVQKLDAARKGRDGVEIQRRSAILEGVRRAGQEKSAGK